MFLSLFILMMMAPAPAADQRPLALSEVDDAARYLFDCARDSRWTEAESQLRTLRDAYEDLPEGLRPADLVASLRRRVDQLPDAVAHRDRLMVMEASNAITQLVIGLSDAYQSTVPAQIPRLAYLGRQIEFGLAAGNRALVARATADIEQTWAELRPELERRRHLADVRRMTDIVASLDEAKLSDDGPLARAELDVVSHLAAEMK